MPDFANLAPAEAIARLNAHHADPEQQTSEHQPDDSDVSQETTPDIDLEA